MVLCLNFITHIVMRLLSKWCHVIANVCFDVNRHFDKWNNKKQAPKLKCVGQWFSPPSSLLLLYLHFSTVKLPHQMNFLFNLPFDKSRITSTVIHRTKPYCLVPYLARGAFNLINPLNLTFSFFKPKPKSSKNSFFSRTINFQFQLIQC